MGAVLILLIACAVIAALLNVSVWIVVIVALVAIAAVAVLNVRHRHARS